MRLTIFTQGDMSVGIPGEELTVDWPGLENDTALQEAAIASLRTTFESLMDGKVSIFEESTELFY